MNLQEWDADFSREIAKKIKAKEKQCFMNSLRAILHPELKGASYVEGYVIGEFGPIQHAWVEFKGRLIEPTRPGEFDAYYPGIKLKARGLSAIMRKRKGTDLPIIDMLPRGSKRIETYKKAMIAAYSACGVDVRGHLRKRK